MGGMDWIDLARDRDRWQAFAKAVFDLRVPESVENFLIDIRLVSQEGLISMEEESK